MDSGNSGSMQSSSGGDEEYDSRAESISAFLNNNNNPLSHVGPMSNNPPPQPDHHHHGHHHHHHHQTHHSSSSSTMLLSNYFDPLSSSSSRSPPRPLTNPNSLLNLDMVWSKNLRSEPNCNDLGGFIPSSSPTQQLFTNQAQTRTTFQTLPPHGQESATRGPAPGSVSGTNDQVSHAAGVRNPKKRSRASRRAPTTVLTTDTTNFRAMVQEFTGIPAPPFTSSPFPRSRLDLFGTAASTLRSAVSHHLDPSPPPYLLRPFAQKFQPPPPPFASSGSTASSFNISSSSSSSMVDAIASTTTTNIHNSSTCNNSSTTSNISSTSINYQLPSDLGLLKQPHNLLNINVQNPILNFHPLFQAPPKYPLPNSPDILGTTKPQQVSSLEIPSNDSHLKMGVLEEFGLSHGHVNTNLTGLQNIVSSSSSQSADATLMRRSDHDSSLANWGDGVGSNDQGDHHHQQQQQQQHGLLRSINGSYNNSTQRVTNGKVNFLAPSSSDFRGDNNKGQENVATRSEGMMESWICSSD